MATRPAAGADTRSGKQACLRGCGASAAPLATASSSPSHHYAKNVGGVFPFLLSMKTDFRGLTGVRIPQLRSSTGLINLTYIDRVGVDMEKGKSLSFKMVSLLLAVAFVSGLTYARWASALTLEERCQTYKENAGPNLQKLDLNKATEEELQTLPGVGIKTARAIVDHRKAISGYKSVEQLKRVRGVGDKLYECLKALVFVKSPLPSAP